VAAFDVWSLLDGTEGGCPLIKIVVTGSECTGKSTLASAIAAQYETVLVPEFVRGFVERKGSAPEFDDVEEIACGQMALEDEHAARAPDLLVLDTDLLSVWVYSNHYHRACPAWIGEAVTRRRGDLYLLVGIDVPWVADGLQRDRGHMRGEMQALFRAELEARGFSFIEIEGSTDERISAAVVAIDALLARDS
jgi:NadR type nicotinamide-nucleotide adenylyltransferase